MKVWTITGFDGINNMQEPSALGQPKPTDVGGTGNVELTDCINFDIDDNNGLIRRTDTQVIFTKNYDAKLTQVHGARTFTALGNTLKYTEPFKTTYDDRRSIIEYASPITMILSVVTGLWVSTTERIYFHSGKNPVEVGGFTVTSEYDASAIMGTGEVIPARKMMIDKDGYVAVFATTKGICVGDQSGGVTNISEGKYSYIPGQRGISHIKEENGMYQYQVRMINDVGTSFNEQTAGTTLDIDSI